MTREEYEELKAKKITETISLLMGKTCKNCLFITKREKCYIGNTITDEINQCDDWQSEGI